MIFLGFMLLSGYFKFVLLGVLTTLLFVLNLDLGLCFVLTWGWIFRRAFQFGCLNGLQGLLYFRVVLGFQFGSTFQGFLGFAS